MDARQPRKEGGRRVQRRHILRTSEAGSLLLTMHSGGETIFKLSGQRRLWVDADALLSLASQAMRAECQGQDPLPLFEEAHALARGAFLEEDLYATWAQGHRHTIDGARHRVLFKLVDLSLKGERVGRGEELLLEALEEDPADEDALCRLMILLVEQGRRREALQLYQYTEDVLQEELTEPAVYTRELAHRIRMGLVLRDRRERYSAMESDGGPRANLNSFGAKRDRLMTVSAPYGGRTSSSYQYRPPRRRFWGRSACPAG